MIFPLFKSQTILLLHFQIYGNIIIKCYYNIQMKTWSILWKLKLLPKLKLFVWRVASGSLPTKTQLKSYHIDIDACCPVCNSAEETIIHCFWDCIFARRCWSRPDLTMLSGHFPTFLDWLDSLFQQFEDEKRAYFVMICWSIWKSRNEGVWNQLRPSIPRVLYWAKTVWNQWIKAQDKVIFPLAAFLSDAGGPIS